jgi:hypothetical protein
MVPPTIFVLLTFAYWYYWASPQGGWIETLNAAKSLWLMCFNAFFPGMDDLLTGLGHILAFCVAFCVALLLFWIMCLVISAPILYVTIGPIMWLLEFLSKQRRGR